MLLLTYIVIIIFTFILTGSIGKLTMSLFAKKKVSYRSGLVVLTSSSIIFYTVALICGTLAALQINNIIGFIVGALLLIGTIGVGYRNALKDARHSLKIAIERQTSRLL